LRFRAPLQQTGVFLISQVYQNLQDDTEVAIKYGMPQYVQNSAKPGLLMSMKNTNSSSNKIYAQGRSIAGTTRRCA
jgi:hypothetical protein